MIDLSNNNRTSDDSSNGLLDIDAVDVTGSHSASARGVDRSTPAGAVARTLAARMHLPDDVPWGLRSDTTGALIDETEPIGRHLQGGTRSKVIMTPRTHLGGAR